jgi:hypothetical protein
VHLIHEAERWKASVVGEAEWIVIATMANFVKVLDRTTVPSGVPAPTAAQRACNAERLQADKEVG